MSPLNFYYILCNEFPTYYRNVINQIPASSKNVRNSLHTKMLEIKGRHMTRVGPISQFKIYLGIYDHGQKWQMKSSKEMAGFF